MLRLTDETNDFQRVISAEVFLSTVMLHLADEEEGAISHAPVGSQLRDLPRRF